jgi:DNA-binding NarL/FixJ family response regulator
MRVLPWLRGVDRAAADRDEGMRAALDTPPHHPSVGVLVLSQYVEPGLAMELLAGSAEGASYLFKDRISDVKEFIAAVRRVSDGGSAIDSIIVSTSFPGEATTLSRN